LLGGYIAVARSFNFSTCDGKTCDENLWNRAFHGQVFTRLRSTFVLKSIRKTAIRSNVRLKTLRDATCGLGFTPAFAPIAVRIRCHRSGWPLLRIVVVKGATLKATNLKQGLAVEAPAFVAFYRADQDFDGRDWFETEIDFSGSRKLLQCFHVSISKSSADGHGIGVEQCKSDHNSAVFEGFSYLR